MMRLLGILLVLMAQSAVAAEKPSLVFAASSLTPVLRDAAAQFEQQTGQRLRLSFGSSSSLVRQMQQGAPAEMILLAHPTWMDKAVATAGVTLDTRQIFARNRLVVVARASNSHPADDWQSALITSTFVTGDPTHVPLGLYVKTSLQHLGLWDAAQDHLLPADTAQMALVWLRQGAAGYAVIYASDAADHPDLEVLAVLPEDSHPPIVYELALTPTAKTAARSFAAFMTGGQGQALLQQHGFLPLSDMTEHATQP